VRGDESSPVLREERTDGHTEREVARIDEQSGENREDRRSTGGDDSDEGELGGTAEGEGREHERLPPRKA